MIMSNDPTSNLPADAGPERGQVGDYTVGYGKPPTHTRFPHQKGARGRPKGARNLKTVFAEAFGATVEAKVGGKIRKMTKFDLTVHQLANKASAGDLKAIDKALGYLSRWDSDTPNAEVSEEQTQRDLSVLDNMIALRRMFDSADGEGGQ